MSFNGKVNENVEEKARGDFIGLANENFTSRINSWEDFPSIGSKLF
jgi:hypothetical protein